MRVYLGPVLYIDDCDEDHWRFRIQLLVEGDATGGTPPLNINLPDEDVDITSTDPAHEFSSYRGNGATYWSWQVKAERHGKDRWISYALIPPDGDEITGLPHEDLTFGDVFIPRRGALPNIAFFSCNGASHEKDYHAMDRPQLLWESMQAEHCRAKDETGASTGRRGFSLLVGGGDQVYADQLWNQAPLKKLRGEDKKDKIAADPADISDSDEGLRVELIERYIDLYVETWSRKYARDMLASVPGVFTWDDHDIMDGWGSHSKEQREAGCYRELFAAASECFEVFQTGGLDANIPAENSGEHFLQSLTFEEEEGHLGVVVPDLRSERTRHQVFSEEQWDDLRRELRNFARGEEEGRERSRHLIVVSAIPLVFRRYRFDDIPDSSGLQDDLIDQWEHGNRRGERARLISRLLAISKRGRCRVTLLSGDVHVGAHGHIVSEHPAHTPEGYSRSQAIIHQLTASAIVHPPPGHWPWRGMRLGSTGDVDHLTDQVKTEMLSVSSEHEYLRARNWLSARFDAPAPSDGNDAEEEGSETEEAVDLDPEGMRLWATWHAEGIEAGPESGIKGAGPVKESVVLEA